MDIKCWIRVSNIVKGFKVSIDFVVACMPENFLQILLEDFETMWVVRQAEFAKNNYNMKEKFKWKAR